MDVKETITISIEKKNPKKTIGMILVWNVVLLIVLLIVSLTVYKISRNGNGNVSKQTTIAASS